MGLSDRMTMNPFAKAFEPKSRETQESPGASSEGTCISPNVAGLELERPLSPLSFLLAQNIEPTPAPCPAPPPGLDDDEDEEPGGWNPFAASFDPPAMNFSFEPAPMNFAFEPKPPALLVPAMKIWSTPEQWMEAAAREQREAPRKAAHQPGDETPASTRLDDDGGASSSSESEVGEGSLEVEAAVVDRATMLLFRERQLRHLGSRTEKVQAPLPITKKDHVIEEMRLQEKKAQPPRGESTGKQEGQQILGLLKEFQGERLRGPRNLVAEVEKRNEQLQEIQRRRKPEHQSRWWSQGGANRVQSRAGQYHYI